MTAERNIFGANRYWPALRQRTGCRGIVERDGKLLVSHERATGWILIPGGGLEPGETLRECVVRELREETGAIVEPENGFLTLNEYYGEYRYTSHYFVCRLLGEGETALTEEEAARGLEPLWMEAEEVYALFSRHEDWAAVSEEKRGSYLREFTALTEYRNLRK